MNLYAAVDCGELPAPANGEVNYVEDTTFESSAIFTCNRGFRLVGDRERECLYTGLWSLQQPTCESMRILFKLIVYTFTIILLYTKKTEITCPKLTPPKYGKVRISGYCVDDYAVYGCAYGHQISHKDRRVCQEDGTWSGSEPTCDRKYVNKYSRHGYQYRG